MASSAAERRRLETPEKFERGVRRTALDADPPFTNPRRVRDVASRGSDGARPRDRLHFVHGGLEARRAGRRRRQPRRRRRENASLRGFLRDGVHRGDAKNTPGGASSARAHALSLSVTSRRAATTNASACVEVSRDAPAGASQRGSGGGNASPRHVPLPETETPLSCFSFRVPISAALASARVASASARCDASTRAREGAAVVRRAFVSR